MAISAKAIKNLPLGKDVQKVITDCFQDWTFEVATAAKVGSAVAEATQPMRST
jgi:hypothetical protein